MRLDDAEVEHQLLVRIPTFIEPTHDLFDVPVEPRAVEQHHAHLSTRLEPGRALPLHGRLVLTRAHDLRAVERNRPQLGKVTEHLHVGIDVEGPTAMAGEPGNVEATEGEAGPTTVLGIFGF